MSEKSLREVCEDKALRGDGAFAIAAAIFDLSDSQEATARALKKIGLADASTPFGALENLAMQLRNSAEQVSQSISEIAQRIGDIAVGLEK